MPEKLMRITCDPKCGFMVQSHNKDELYKIVKGHMKNIHNKDATDADVKKMVKMV